MLILVAAVVILADKAFVVRAQPFSLTTFPLGSQEVGKNFQVLYSITDDSPTATLSWNGSVVTYVGVSIPGDGVIAGIPADPPLPAGSDCFPVSTGVPPPALVYQSGADCLANVDSDGLATIRTTSATFQCTALGPVIFTLSQAPGPDMTANFLCVVAVATPTPTLSAGNATATAVAASATAVAATATAQALPTTIPRDNCFEPRKPIDNVPPACAVVITADPNLVACGGTSLITATVRDRDGHVVLGYGFHFTTNHGLLSVGPPNNAGAESASAILRLFPPGSDNPTGSNTAEVIVSVGLALGTVEGGVTVQQHCPSDQTRAGAIAVIASAPVVPCNGRVFLAATLKDVLGNPVPDDTEITFLASAGSVADEAIATAATPTAGSGDKPSVKVKTRGGTAHIIYTADAGAKGTVRITAASGAAFGYLDLTVCAVVGGVTPPNTGTGISIRPPNTGDGGVAR